VEEMPQAHHRKSVERGLFPARCPIPARWWATLHLESEAASFKLPVANIGIGSVARFMRRTIDSGYRDDRDSATATKSNRKTLEKLVNPTGMAIS